jgi:hypothetical protein
LETICFFVFCNRWTSFQRIYIVKEIIKAMINWIAFYYWWQTMKNRWVCVLSSFTFHTPCCSM